MEKILVSACLLGVNCKYKDGNNRNEKVLEYIKDKQVIPICPEIMGGLPTPRLGAEQLNGRVILEDGTDVTENFQKGANEVLYLAKLFGAKKALLKQLSPSCGVGQVYDGTFSHTIINDDGETTKLLKENGIEVLTEEDL